MGARVLVTILAFVHVAGGDTSCADSGSCELHGDDETSLLARHSRPKPLGLASAVEKTGTGCTKIGTLALDGYYWPTQAGDANDVRTYCRVKPEDVDNFNYSCALPYGEDEYGTVIATVKNFTFANAQAQYMGGMKEAFGDAVKYFLEDPDVCAIKCNVGFCAFYQSLVEKAITDLIVENPKLERKPMLLGSPLLALEYLSQQDASPTLSRKPIKELGPNEAIIIITAHYPSLNDGLVPLFNAVVAGAAPAQVGDPLAPLDAQIRKYLEKKGLVCPEGFATFCAYLHKLLKMTAGGALSDLQFTAALNASTEDLRKKVYIVGWNEMPGYKPVDLGGGFHNALLTSQNYRTYNYGGLDRIMREIEKNGTKVVGVVVESTEQATNSNDIRIDFGLPVWDFTTMGLCLAAAAKGDFDTSNVYIIDAVFDSKAFSDCLLKWSEPGKLEPKFGKQPDGTFRFYENLTKDEILTLTCVGGRPAGHPPIGRLMENFDIGVPDHLRPREVCWTTELCKCSDDVEQLTAPCDDACPGSGNCGGGVPPYPCGANGEKCTTLADVPPRASKCYNLGKASRFGPANQSDNSVIYATT